VPRGRKTKYTEALAKEICSRVSKGELRAAVCREEGMPASRTVYQWLKDHEAFRSRYARVTELKERMVA